MNVGTNPETILVNQINNYKKDKTLQSIGIYEENNKVDYRRGEATFNCNSHECL